MVSVRLQTHISLLLDSLSTNTVNYNLLRLCSICLVFFSQIISSSSSESVNLAMAIVKSMDEPMCENHVFTCLFRVRHHKPFDKHQLLDNCRYLLILHSCLHHDADIVRTCSQTAIKRAQINLDKEPPKPCFTSPAYKTFYAQHLRSIAPSRTIVKCRIFVLFLLLIAFYH